MLTNRLAVVASLMIITAALSPAAADRVVVEPNAPSARPDAVSSEKPDPRLSKPVDCQVGYKRLHQVAADLSKTSGVAIRCGKNGSDWKLRDAPLVVWTKGISLGKLLSAIAGCVHMQLTSEKVEGDSAAERAYRLYRTKKGQKEIDSPAAAKLEAATKLADWSWDALVAYADGPELPLPSTSQEMGTDPKAIRLVGKILASLGPEGKAKAFAGDVIKLRAKGSPRSALLKELYPVAWPETKRQQQELMPQYQITADEAGLNPDDCFLVVHVYRVKFSGDVIFSLTMGGYPSGIIKTSVAGASVTQCMPLDWRCDGVKAAKVLDGVKGLNLPPRPKQDYGILEIPDGPPLPDAKPLKTDEDWKLPLLQAKAGVEIEGDKDKAAFADVLAALSKSTGLNIICEDFKSQKANEQAHVALDFTSKATVAEVLHKLGEMDWYISESDRLLIGRSKPWRWYHATLVPEDLLTRLRKKLNGGGAELDDWMEVMRLTRGQKDSWIEWAREFKALGESVRSEDMPLWKLYDALTPDQKKLARSEEGLLLGSLGPGWASEFLKQKLREETKGSYSLSANEEPWEQTARTFADAQAIDSSVLQVVCESVTGLSGYNVVNGPNGTIHVGGPLPDALKAKHTYAIVLRGHTSDGNSELRASLRAAFPICSLDREPVIRGLRSKMTVQDRKP